jgi:hypothetical protein
MGFGPEIRDLEKTYFGSRIRIRNTVWCRDDVLGAQAAGLQGALVRTGKYRPEDEHRKGSLGI